MMCPNCITKDEYFAMNRTVQVGLSNYIRIHKLYMYNAHPLAILSVLVMCVKVSNTGGHSSI